MTEAWSTRSGCARRRECVPSRSRPCRAASAELYRRDVCAAVIVDAAVAVEPGDLDERRRAPAPPPIDREPAGHPRRTAMEGDVGVGRARLRPDGLQHSPAGRFSLAVHCQRNSPGREPRAPASRPCVHLVRARERRPEHAREQQQPRQHGHHFVSASILTRYFCASDCTCGRCAAPRGRCPVQSGERPSAQRRVSGGLAGATASTRIACATIARRLRRPLAWRRLARARANSGP